MDKNKIDAILTFLPYFSNQKNHFFIRHPAKKVNKTWYIEDHTYPVEVIQFIEKLYTARFIVPDYLQHTDTIKSYLENPSLIQQATLPMLKYLFAFIVRGSRFNDAILGEQIKNGNIVRLLLRLQELNAEQV